MKRKHSHLVNCPDTRPNPQGTYYQYIHPVNLSKKQYDYRYLGVIKNGIMWDSLPFPTMKECHAALKKFIEEQNDEVTSTSPE